MAQESDAARSEVGRAATGHTAVALSGAGCGGIGVDGAKAGRAARLSSVTYLAGWQAIALPTFEVNLTIMLVLSLRRAGQSRDIRYDVTRASRSHVLACVGLGLGMRLTGLKSR